MTQKEIDALLEKFESGKCSPEEEKLVDQLLDDQAAEMGDVYGAFISNEKTSVSKEEIDIIVNAEDGNLDKALDEQFLSMDEVYDDFIASAKNVHSTIDVSLTMKAADGSLDKVLKRQREEMGTEYENFVIESKKTNSTINIDLSIQATDGQLDKQLESQLDSMGSSYNNYVASAKKISSKIDVNLVLQAENGELDKMLAEQELGEAYRQFVENEQKLTSNIDVDLLVQSLNGGLDELLNQQEQGMSKEYAEFVTKEKAKTSNTRIEELLPQEEKKEEAKVIPFRRRVSKYSTIAAVFLAIFAAIFLMKPNFGVEEGLMTKQERIEAEKALEQTLAALGMAKSNLDKGKDNMKALNSLKHTNIFK